MEIAATQEASGEFALRLAAQLSNEAKVVGEQRCPFRCCRWAGKEKGGTRQLDNLRPSVAARRLWRAMLAATNYGSFRGEPLQSVLISF